jgi:hypothetical protein
MLVRRKNDLSKPTDTSWARGPGRARPGAAADLPFPLSWIDACAAGKLWWLRLPLLLWMAWIWAHHATDPDYQPLLKGLNLGIHELGHIVFSLFGQFLTIAGGSILQCLAPVAGMAMFVRQRDPFAICFAFGWLGTNFFDVATYAADARAMELPLVSPFGGDEITHDWNWLLDDLGWLAHDQAIAGMFRFAGHLSFALCLVGGAWTLWRMRVRGDGLFGMGPGERGD